MNVRFLCLLFGFAVSCIPFLTAQDIQSLSALEIVQKVSQNYRDLKSCSLRFTVVTELTSDESSKTIETEVEISVSRPNKARLTLSGGLGELELVSDGSATWISLPALKQYQRRAGSLEAPVPGGASASGLTLESLASDLRGHYEGVADDVSSATVLRKETLPLEEKEIECLVVEVRSEPKSHARSASVRTYWIDPERWLVLKRLRSVPPSADDEDSFHTRVTTTFSRVSLNEPIPDSQFVYQPPDGFREVAEFRRTRPNALQIGEEAPAFRLKDLDGQEISLDSLRGNVVLLNFWASWCGPCRLEMPVIEKLHREHRDRLKVFGVNDEEIGIIREYVAEQGYTFPTLVDEDQATASSYRVRAIPTMVVIDREGKIAHYRAGLSRESDLRAWLKKAGVD